MWFFDKKQPDVDPTPTLDLSATTRDRIEIQLTKDASAEAKQEVQKVNTHLKGLLGENGFHVKIYIAAGGTPKGGQK